MAGNRELRQRLQRITDEYTEWVVQIQISAVESLREEYPHGIKLVQAAVVGEPRTFDFNCHAFAFQLHELDAFWKLRQAMPMLRPTGEFVLAWLVPAMTRVDSGDAKPGDIILYYDRKRVTHSGIVSARGIESKWGTSHRWEHGVFEIPSSYGAVVRYFRSPDPPSVLTAYLAFAECKRKHR